MARSRLKQRAFVPALLLLLLGTAGGGVPTGAKAQDRPIVIKLATLAPADTRWHDIYKEMGARWAEASGGKVKLIIYPGGVAGEEIDVFHKMRIGQLHAGGITLAGLTFVSDEATVLAIPFLVKTPEELDRLMAAVGPRLEAILAERGYVVLNWGYVGWMRFFLPDSVTSVEAVKKYRFPAWGNDKTSDLWTAAGFRNVLVPLPEILPGLHTGLVDAIGTTPLVVLANQWSPFVPYMLDIPWAPLVGATLVDKRVWEGIAPELRNRLMAIARESGEQLQAEILRLEMDAIHEMEIRGMKIVRPTPEEMADWQSLFDSVHPKLRGTLIPEDLFDEALRVIRGEGGR